MTTHPDMVAITGASGYVGARLLQELEEETNRPGLLAIDTRSLPLPIHDIKVVRRDVITPIDDVLRQHRVNTVVHLAFITRRGRNRSEVDSIRQANVGALRSALDSCVRARVNHFIYLSSHTVYGARARNPIPITERMGPDPLPDFPYGYDKYFSERILQEFGMQHPEIKITILRSCVILGPTARNEVTRAFFRPWLLGALGYNPPLQFIHEDDLARALTIIIQQGIPGVFNLAADGVVFYEELVDIIHSKLVSLPSWLAYPLLQVTWKLRIQRESTPAGLNFIRYPIILSAGRLKQTTGYKFWYTSLEALTSYANTQLL